MAQNKYDIYKLLLTICKFKTIKNPDYIRIFYRIVQYFDDLYYAIATIVSVRPVFAINTSVFTTLNASTATRATSTRRSLCSVCAWIWEIAFFTILFLYKRIKICHKDIIIIIYFLSLSNFLVLFYYKWCFSKWIYYVTLFFMYKKDQICVDLLCFEYIFSTYPYLTYRPYLQHHLS